MTQLPKSKELAVFLPPFFEEREDKAEIISYLYNHDELCHFIQKVRNQKEELLKNNKEILEDRMSYPICFLCLPMYNKKWMMQTKCHDKLEDIILKLKGFHLYSSTRMPFVESICECDKCDSEIKDKACARYKNSHCPFEISKGALASTDERENILNRNDKICDSYKGTRCVLRREKIRKAVLFDREKFIYDIITSVLYFSVQDSPPGVGSIRNLTTFIIPCDIRFKDKLIVFVRDVLIPNVSKKKDIDIVITFLEQTKRFGGGVEFNWSKEAICIGRRDSSPIKEFEFESMAV